MKELHRFLLEKPGFNMKANNVVSKSRELILDQNLELT